MTILEQLKQQRFRLTKPRKEIIKVLAHYPLTAQEVHDSLRKKKIKIDLASVYRTLELFDKMQIIHWTELGGGKKRYELIDDSNHHHHVVCSSCGAIEDVAFPEDAIVKELKNKTKFKIDHHHLEFFGLCPNCL